MDKALSRYLEIKDYVAPPEVALISAYAAYFAAVSTNETVKNNFKKRFGGFAGKFGFLQKIANKFKKPGNQKSLGKD